MEMITEKSNRGRTGKSVVEATAYHEAGHVAAQLYFRHPFIDVTISDESSGCVRHKLNKRLEEIIEYGMPTASDERYLKHEMIILIAGGVAEAKYLRCKNLSAGSKSDISEFVRYCECGGIYNKALTHYSGYIIETAKALFEKKEFWLYVKALANLLYEKKTVKYLECKKTYIEICGHLHFN